jgi:hypothetical protein
VIGKGGKGGASCCGVEKAGTNLSSFPTGWLLPYSAVVGSKIDLR